MLRLEEVSGRSPLHDVKDISAGGIGRRRIRLLARAMLDTLNALKEAQSVTARTNKVGGARRDRTDDLLLAKQALSQLSYGPPRCRRLVRMVGLGRFELPTSRLSSARSNQLSYRPRATRSARAIRTKSRAKGCSNDLWIAWARPRRKRNVDGEIPPKDMPILKLTRPDVFLSDPIDRSVMPRSEGSSLERR